MKKKIKRKGETGITLIALIITIIVLLILAGVSISMVVGDNGILSQAVNAADSTDVAETKEAIVAGAGVSWEYDDDGNVTNGSVTLAIGDYIDYDPTNYDGYDADTAIYTSEESANGYATQVFSVATYASTDCSWRVLGVDEDTGELLIISEDIIGPDSGGLSWNGETYFYIGYQAGYVNGDDEMDNVSELFGNGYGATGARSVTVEDVNKITGYVPENDSYYDGSTYEYGNTVTYTKNSDGYIYYKGTIYPTESTKSGYTSFTYYDKTSKSWISLGTNESITYTENAYWYYPDILTGDTSVTEVTGISTDSTEYEMLFLVSDNSPLTDYRGTTELYYWLAGSCVGCNVGYVSFSWRDVEQRLCVLLGLFYFRRRLRLLRLLRCAPRSFSINWYLSRREHFRSLEYQIKIYKRF